MNAGIVATKHCCSVSERCATAVFVPARLTAHSAHTTRNCGRYSRFGTAHWRRSKTKTGTSATQVQKAVAAEKATGLKLMLNKALVSIVRSTARTTYSKTTRIEADAKAARLHETTGLGGRASSSSSSAGAPFLRRGARLMAVGDRGGALGEAAKTDPWVSLWGGCAVRSVRTEVRALLLCKSARILLCASALLRSALRPAPRIFAT